MQTLKKLHDEDVENGSTIPDIELQNELIIDEYLLEIDSLEKKAKIPQVISIFSFAIYLVHWTICISTKVQGNYLYTLIPGLIGIISLAAFMNLYIKLIETFSDARVFIETGKKQIGMNVGSMISYFTINVTAIGVVFYLIGVTAKAQEVTLVQMSMLNIPIYIIFGVAIFYFLFFLPALLKERAIWSTVLFVLFSVCGFIFLITLSMLLDKTMVSGKYINCFIVLWIPFGFLVVWAVLQFLEKNKEDKIDALPAKISRLIAIFLVLIFTILVPLKLDGMINIFNWAIMLFPITAYTMVFSERLKVIFSNEETPESINAENNNYK